MKRFSGLAIAAMTVSFMGLLGCAESMAPTVRCTPEIGSHCVVHFRRDALGPWGQRFDDPAIAIDGYAGEASGSFSRMDANWLVLTQKDSERWIPLDMILLLKVFEK